MLVIGATGGIGSFAVHGPEDVARDFAGTAAMVAAHGFRPRHTPYEHWGRARADDPAPTSSDCRLTIRYR